MKIGDKQSTSKTNSNEKVQLRKPFLRQIASQSLCMKEKSSICKMFVIDALKDLRSYVTRKRSGLADYETQESCQ